MKSFTTLRNLYGKDTKNEASANLTYGDEIMNDFHRRLLAKADWPFLHRPRLLTSVAPSSTFTAVAGTDVCTAVSAVIQTATGTPVKLETTSALPAGLSEDTLYYMVYQSATTFKLATSLANAYAGTVIDITDTGTGTHTVLVQTDFQPLPYDVDQVESVSLQVASTTYSPTPSPSRQHWDELHYNVQTSNSPQNWFVENGQIAVWPRQSTAGNIITLNSKIRVQDLNVADYTTGTVDIVTNGSILVTGSGTSWTAAMVGRYIRITHSNTAASSGDGLWYEITSVPSSTTLTLARPYGGRSLTTGAAAAYIIGQMPLLPEAFHDIPEIYGAFRYWTKEDNEKRAKAFRDMLEDGITTLFKTYGLNDLSMVIDDGESHTLLNPNLTVTL